MKILYSALAFLLVVAIVYKYATSRHRTRKDLILESRTILTFFQNDENFVVFRIIGRNPFRDPLLVKLFWRINGQCHSLDCSDPIVFLSYVDEIKRVGLITFKGIYFYDPLTNQKEELDISPRCIFLACTGNGAPDLLLLGYQADGKVDERICVYLDLMTRKSQLFRLEGDFRGACKTAPCEYHVKTTKYLYKVTPSLIELNETDTHRKADLWLQSCWQNGELILQRIQNRTRTLIWNNVELEFGGLYDAFVSGGYLRVYDYVGHGVKNIPLRQRVSKCGTMPDGGIWVFYSDDSVDVFGKDGRRVSTEYLDIRL